MSSAAGLALRGHMVRRLPTAADVSTRSPIVLTPRDVEILAGVHLHGFLTTELVELAFFPPTSTDRCSPSSRAYQRLRELWLWGYLERVELPVARVLGGRRPFLYALGKQAVPLVESRLGTTTFAVQLRRLDRLDHVFVDHDLRAAAIWANLRAQLRNTNQRLHWVSERELRARRMRVRAPRGDYWLPFLPDAYFEVAYTGEHVQCAIVEIAMGTLTLRRFRRMVHSFEAALYDGVFRRHFARERFDVLILTQSERRLESLRQAADGVVEGERRCDYYLATFDALQPTVFSHWQRSDLDGETSSGV